jgi:hypothetical protein
MYRTADGEEIFIIDGHTHLWDGSKENQRNIHGGQFIDCFYGYHTALSPKEYVWPKEKFDKYSPDTMYNDPQPSPHFFLRHFNRLVDLRECGCRILHLRHLSNPTVLRGRR